MTGAAFLVIGLLLIVAGLLGPRSGEAPGASPDSRVADGTERGMGRYLAPAWSRNPIRTLLLSPFDRATWYANAALASGPWIAMFALALVAGLVSSGLGLLPVGVGIVLVALGIEAARLMARVERWRASLADRRPLRPHAYRPYGGSLRETVMAEFADEGRWRDVVYVAVNAPLSMLEFLAAFGLWALALALITTPLWYDLDPRAAMPAALGVLGSHGPAVVVVRVLVGAALLPLAASTSQGLMALHRAVVAGLLCASETRELERRVATLTESRSAVLDVEASELRRIERDLHDGAQQRLVMLTIDLSLAAERVESDPAAARQLIGDARDQARLALAELRDLVRGISPAILLDRGLVPALSAIAGRSRVPTVVESSLPAGVRLPMPVERAAYFVVTEALANVAKHSAATNCRIRCWGEGERLVVEVWDDGKGGAELCPGGGLAGLAGRVEALDGLLRLDSPEGGPTLLHAEFPLVPLVQRETRWMPAPRPVPGGTRGAAPGAAPGPAPGARW